MRGRRGSSRAGDGDSRASGVASFLKSVNEKVLLLCSVESWRKRGSELCEYLKTIHSRQREGGGVPRERMWSQVPTWLR